DADDLIAHRPAGQEHRIDPHELALHIDQRATTVPRIYRGIRLNIVIVLGRSKVASSSANDASSQCLLKAKRASDGQYPVTWLKGIRVPKHAYWKVAAVNLDYRNI